MFDAMKGTHAMNAKEDPVACTLAPGDFSDRVEAIAALNRDALQRYTRDDLALDLVYASMASPRVRDMVRREQECCAFLRFDVLEDANAVRVRITAPETARSVASSLFEQFISKADASTPACGCP
jgi:hypothetical protein